MPHLYPPKHASETRLKLGRSENEHSADKLTLMTTLVTTLTATITKTTTGRETGETGKGREPTCPK